MAMTFGNATFILVVLGVIVLGAGIWCWIAYQKLRSDSQHRASFLNATVGAALSGAVFAVIVSGSLYYLQHSQEASDRAAAEQQHEAEIRNRIIALTKRELSDDLKIIQATKALARISVEAFSS
jgi:hypothetical protein